MKRYFGKCALFSLAALAAAVFFSCDGLQGDAANPALVGTEQASGAGQGGVGSSAFAWAGVQTLSGQILQEGIMPAEFSLAPVLDSGVSKSIFPTPPTASSLTYTVSGTATVHGEAVSASGTFDKTTNKYSIELPYESSGTEWSVTISAKSSGSLVLSKTETITIDSRSPAATPFQLEYSTSSTDGLGDIRFDIGYDTTSAVSAITVFFNNSSVGSDLTLDSGTANYTIYNVTPGPRDIKIVFYDSNGTAIYAIVEKALVYANMTTNKFVGTAPYISSGSVSLTATEIENFSTASAEGGIWVGGTGIVSGAAANDANDGTKFAPVATLYRAFQIANSLAAIDSSKTYTINVQGDVVAGTSANKTATINSGVKVEIIGDNASSASWRTISGVSGSTAGTYNIISSGAEVTFQYFKFEKLSSIQVAAGTLTINDCSVAGGDSQSGFVVSSGATLKSTQGLTISNCRRAAGGGGIFCEGTLTLTGTTISGCRSLYSSSGGDYSGCGGALLVSGSSASASLSSCTIGVASPTGSATSSDYSNYAGKMGGGVYVAGGAAVTLGTKTTVQYNCAAGTSTTEGESGGGGVFVNNGTLSLTAGTYPVTIGYNYAATFGGGLCISSSCVKAIELKGYFYKNSAANGGAIYTASGAAVTTPTATASAPNIGANGKGNTATTAGGGIYIASSGFSLACANIDYNTAASGAGVYLDTSGSAIFTKGYITNNTASSSGGGIYNKGSLYLCGVKIQSNKATTFGGGIYTESKVCLYTSGSNWTDIGGSSSTYANKTTGPSGQGGGVYVADGGLYLGYSEYEGSTKTTAAWGGKISANTANMGGGVYVNKGELVMRQGMIGGTNSDYANTSTTLGGGVYMQKDTTFQITGDASGSGSIRYNTAGTAGGGVYCLGTLNFDYGNIVNNTATTVGDGVCLAVASSKVGAINLGSMAYMGAGTADANDIFLSTVNDPIDGSSAGTKYNKVTVSDSTLSYKFMISIPSDTAETWLGYGVKVLNSTGGMTLANALKKFSIRQLKNQTLEFTTASGFGVIRVCANYAAAGNVTLPGTAITNPKTSGIFIAGRTFKLPKILASRYECTQGEYEKYCRYGSTQPSSTSYGSGADYPVYFVSWYDAIVYCNLRSMAEGLDPVYSVDGKTDPTKWTGIYGSASTGYYAKTPDDKWKSVSIDYTKSGWRLPFEVEWEYLARDGNLTNTGQYYYSGGNTATDVGWIYDNAEGSTHPVGGKTKTTTLQMADMTGNVWEWTNDWHIDTLTTSIGLTGPSTGSNRQARNSGYRQSTGNTLEYRNEGSLPTSRFDDLGFRVVRTIE